MFALVACAYTIAASLTAFHQARQLLQRRRSCEISALLFSVYSGGYALWLAYGLSTSNAPIVAANAVGLISVATVLIVALSLRGSFLQPRTWRSCTVSLA